MRYLIWPAVLTAAVLGAAWAPADDGKKVDERAGAMKFTLEGKVLLTLHSNLPDELQSMLTMSSGFGSGGAMYPPTSEAEARHFFPPKDFVLKVQQKKADNGKTLTVEASFKNVNALLASPYGRAHQLSLSMNSNGSLKLQALSGGSE